MFNFLNNFIFFTEQKNDKMKPFRKCREKSKYGYQAAEVVRQDSKNLDPLIDQPIRPIRDCRKNSKFGKRLNLTVSQKRIKKCDGKSLLPSLPTIALIKGKWFEYYSRIFDQNS